MNITLTRMYAILIGALGIIGLFVSGHLFQIMNTDIAIDVLRIVLAAYLVYVGFMAKSDKMANTALMIVGGLYVVMALVGLFSSTLGGILPSGLTGFDIVFHLATGLLAAGVAMRKTQNTHAHA
jgi:hypothetical protein